MARVFVAPHPNNELRNARHVGIRGRSSSPSLPLPLYLCLCRVLFLRPAGASEQARSNRYYTVLRGRRACCIKRKGEEESLRIAPTWFRRGLPRGSRWKAERFWIIVDIGEDAYAFLVSYRCSARCSVLERAIEPPEFTGGTLEYVANLSLSLSLSLSVSRFVYYRRRWRKSAR